MDKILILVKTEGRRGREQKRMRFLDSTTNAMDMKLSTLWEIMENRGVWWAAVQGVTESDVT